MHTVLHFAVCCCSCHAHTLHTVYGVSAGGRRREWAVLRYGDRVEEEERRGEERGGRGIWNMSRAIE
eukprot:2838487-Rhodomonas_salina.1